MRYKTDTRRLIFERESKPERSPEQRMSGRNRRDEAGVAQWNQKRWLATVDGTLAPS
jgi:hypothetical protein